MSQQLYDKIEDLEFENKTLIEGRDDLMEENEKLRKENHRLNKEIQSLNDVMTID